MKERVASAIAQMPSLSGGVIANQMVNKICKKYVCMPSCLLGCCTIFSLVLSICLLALLFVCVVMPAF